MQTANQQIPESSPDQPTFKIATEGWEFEAIHRLNYKTFVEEIPQHATNADGRLVDRFHAENTYFICIQGKQLLAMVCLRSARPFSLDQKLANIEQYLPAGKRLCEIRLLAVESEVRNGRVTLELFRFLARHAIERGYDLGIMSGTTRQAKLYARLGFVAFGPVVGEGEATYQPMYLSLNTFATKTLTLLRMPPVQPDQPANFLPGPVKVLPAVHAAMSAPPVSHRAASFSATLQDIKRELCALTHAGAVDVLLGSGTLANDMVAAQLKIQSQPGLILSNGEFGERLIDHATRQQLSFERVALTWGDSFDSQDIARLLDTHPQLRWLWMTHCETSTGILNDVEAISTLCRTRHIALCLDAISSIGVVPVDLTNIYLATAVSGKGLAAYPGLSMVFRHHAIQPAPLALPRYLDLGVYAAQADGETPFTHSSNLLQALAAALCGVDWHEKFQRIAADGEALRDLLRHARCTLIAESARVSPAVITLAIPREHASMTVGEQLERAGFLLSYRSRYLHQRNWLQICLMGEYTSAQLRALAQSINQSL